MATAVPHTTLTSRRRSIPSSNTITPCESCGHCHAPGSNHVYQYRPGVDEALTCPLCGQPLLDPMDCTPCSHTFCCLCLLAHFRQVAASCPLDNRAVRVREDVRQASLSLRRLLDGLIVVCPNNAYCDRTMTRVDLESHLRYRCRGAPAPCPMRERGCAHVGPRCQLEEHLLDACEHAANFSTGAPPPDVIVLQKDRGAVFGVLICSSKQKTGVYVYNIQPGSIADGALNVGDRIVQANDINLTECSPDHASLVISQLVGAVKFKVERVAACIHPVVKTVQLVKEPHEVFGMKVLGGVGSKHGHRPVHVADIRPGGVVDQCCHIQRGDIILSINGVSLLGKTCEEAVQLLENTARLSCVTMVLQSRSRVSRDASQL